MRALVVGLGRIGLPVSLVMADSGIETIGVDLDERHVSSLKLGEVPFEEPEMEEILQTKLGEKFFPASWNDLSEEMVRGVDNLVITIGVHDLPFPEEANLSPLYKILDKFADLGILEGGLVIIRPTLPIGTTKKLEEYIQENFGIFAGVDYNMAYVPERLMEGRAITEERALPKVIGPVSDGCFERAKYLFSAVGGEIVRLKDPKHAEFAKLIDNSWRHTIFAYSNDLAYVADSEGIDVIQTIESVNTGYGRNNVPAPGPVSGYCLGKDPIILEYSLNKVPERRASVWMSALDSSHSLVDWTRNRIVGEKVLIAGTTFKEDIDDMRMSFSEGLAIRLIRDGVEFDLLDPHMGKNRYTKVWESIESDFSGESFNDIDKCLSEKKYDTIIIAVRHKEFYAREELFDSQGKIIDLWNIYDRELTNRVGFGT